MADPRRPRAAVATTASPWLAASLLALLAGLAALPARGQDAPAEATATDETATEGGDADSAEATEAPADGGAAEEGSGATTVSHGYSYFGDLKYPADFAHLDYVNPDAPKGGEFSTWAQGNFDSFNPYTIQGNATAWGTSQFESLMTGTFDEAGTSYCLVCETVEYPASLAWAEFTLRPEAAFSDGSPLTAHDVKFSHDIFMEQGLESYRMATAGYITAVEVLDDRRVRFEFSPEAPARDRIPLAGGLTILSRAEFERTGARIDESSDVPFLGSGPYVLTDWDMGRSLVFTRDEDYWAEDLPISRGRNNFDTIRVEYFADSTVALEAFKAGEYTFRSETDALLWATAYDSPALDAGHMVREEVPNGLIPLAAYWAYNLRRETFQDPRVREALALMFNFEWTNATLLYGLFEPLPSFFANTEMMAEGLPTPEEAAILQPLVDEGLLDPSILTAEAVLPATSNPERDLDRANLRRASDLLDEAGWVIDADGVRRNADGEALRVEILEFSPTFERLTVPFVENLKRLGVDASFEIVDSAQFTQRRDTSDFDMTRWSPGMGFEPGSGLEQWFGSEAAAESNRNLVGLQHPGVDRIIAQVASATTREEMHAGARALDRVLRAERLGVPRWYNPDNWIAYFDVYEHPATLPPFGTGELDFWWYDEARAAEISAAGAID